MTDRTAPFNQHKTIATERTLISHLLQLEIECYSMEAHSQSRAINLALDTSQTRIFQTDLICLYAITEPNERMESLVLAKVIKLSLSTVIQL